MNWEGFRTLLLTVLVLLSFVLTWNLWTNQIGNHKSEGSNFVYSDIIKKGGKKKITQVIQPDRAVYYDGKSYYGFEAGKSLNDIFQTISNAKYNFVYTQSHASGNQKENVNQPVSVPHKNRVELQFPTPIPLSSFGKILLGSNQGKTKIDQSFENATLFNSIIFVPSDKSQSNAMVAYFMDDSSVKAKAKLNNAGFSDLKNVFTHHQQLFLAKSDKKNAHIFYIQAEPKTSQVSYSYDMISPDKFKNALFPSTNVVHPYNDYYTSESLFMRASNYTIKFINSAPGTGNSKTSSNQALNSIGTSFNYINSHSGWTDHYILFNYTHTKQSNFSSQSTIVYRLLVGNSKSDYPVFNSGTMPFNIDAGTIHTTVQNGDIAELSRSMMNLKQRIYGSSVKLRTGEQVWDDLTSNQNINMKLVTDIRVGYQMTYPPANSKKITFQPKWYVQYDGNWQSLDQLSGTGEKGKRGSAS